MGKKEQDDIKHLQEFIRSCGTFANLRKQADSKQKIIDKMVEAGLTEKPVPDPQYRFRFPDSEKLPPPVLAFEDVAFSYSGKKEDYLYKKLNFGVDLDSRVALVGPNGAGKSTLLKLMKETIQPCEGQVKRHGHLRIGEYTQHSEDQLDLEKSPLDFLNELYPQGIMTTSGLKKMEMDDWRGYLGRFGVTQDRQLRPMKQMSNGFRTRVVFVLIALKNPHILLLDEPTNHHDFRLIGQVAKDIWVCDQKTVRPWPDNNIKKYKEHLKSTMKLKSTN